MHIARHLITTTLLLFTLASATKSQNYDKAIAEFERYMKARLDNRDYVGVAVGFEKDGYVWTNGYGLADIENNTPVTANSAFRLASISKSITATAILMLVDRGKIDLDAEVQTYVPSFPKKQFPLTVRPILGHLSGISHYKNFQQESNHTDEFTTEEALDIFRDWDLLFEPGERMSYTSYGYNLLGAIVEGASGMSFGDFLQANIFGPLDMNDTRLDSQRDIIPNRVRGYVFEDGRIRNSRHVTVTMKYGGGGIRSTVGDLIKFVQGVQDAKLLSDSLRDLMWTSMQSSDGALTGYGMGWSIDQFNGRFLVSHSGGQDETSTAMFHLPRHDLTIVAFSNFENSDPWDIVFQLRELILDENYISRNWYTGDQSAEYMYAAIRNTFRYGVAHFDRYRNALSTQDSVLASAFAYLNRIGNPVFLRDSVPMARMLIDEGIHPRAGEPFKVLGSYIADRLVSSGSVTNIEDIFDAGPFGLMKSWVDLCNADAKISQAYRLNTHIANIVSKWAASHMRLASVGPSPYDLYPSMPIDSIAGVLVERWKEEPIYPDLSVTIADFANADLASGKTDRVMKWARFVSELYPGSDQALVMAAMGDLLGGDVAAARTKITKAYQINPRGDASASALNSDAYRLRNAGQIDGGLAILEIACELHKGDANLRDSMGEFYLAKGDREKAVEFYRMALEIDPEFENAKRMLEQISKEKSTAP